MKAGGSASGKVGHIAQSLCNHWLSKNWYQQVMEANVVSQERRELSNSYVIWSSYLSGSSFKAPCIDPISSTFLGQLQAKCQVFLFKMILKDNTSFVGQWYACSGLWHLLWISILGASLHGHNRFLRLISTNLLVTSVSNRYNSRLLFQAEIGGQRWGLNPGHL